MFYTKLIFNLRSEASKTYLSYIWWILEPLLYVAVLYVVFGIFLQRNEDNFLLFLICGQIPFLWFSKSVQNASNSIANNRSLISQAAIPKVLFPLLAISQDFVKQTIVFVFLLIILACSQIGVKDTWLFLPILIIVQFFLIGAVSFIVASIVPFLPDVRFLVSTGMMLLMFGSGIFYSYKSVILVEHQSLFLLNPIARLVKNYRDILIYGNVPEISSLTYIFMLSLLFIILACTLIWRLDGLYARKVI